MFTEAVCSLMLAVLADAGAVHPDKPDFLFSQYFHQLMGKLGMVLEIQGISIGMLFHLACPKQDKIPRLDQGNVCIIHGYLRDSSHIKENA